MARAERLEFETIQRLTKAGIESRFVHPFDPHVKHIYEDVWAFEKSEDFEKTKEIGILPGCRIAVLEWKEGK